MPLHLGGGAVSALQPARGVLDFLQLPLQPLKLGLPLPQLRLQGAQRAVRLRAQAEGASRVSVARQRGLDRAQCSEGARQ